MFLGSDSWPSITSNIELIDGKYIFSVSNPSRKWMEKYWNYIYILDTSMNIPLNVKLDSLHVIYHILAENLKHFYLLASTQDTDNLYHIRFTVQETNDSGKTFKTINSINQEFTIDQIY